jgi:hypothetical protein
MKRLLLVLVLVLVGFTSAYAKAAGWEEVEKVFAQKGKTQGDTYKLTFPRSDLSIRMGDVTVEPALGLTSWIGFRKMGSKAMMMGDLVLLEKEVAPVESALVSQGIDITAIHNHLIGSNPPVIYLHVGAHGDPGKLASAIRAALSATGTPMTAPAPAEAKETPDWSKVEKILGKSGQRKGDVLQMSFNRKEKITENGMEIPPFLGVAFPVNLQMVNGKAASTGDFVLLAKEVNPVIAALVQHGITVTAVHSHMLFENPRLFFLHWWAYDEPEKVARGLKAALDRTNIQKR